jgi:hypothetical protein
MSLRAQKSGSEGGGRIAVPTEEIFRLVGDYIAERGIALAGLCAKAILLAEVLNRYDCVRGHDYLISPMHSEIRPGFASVPWIGCQQV